MIKIYKDNDEKVVTRGAYDNLYKSLGYNIVIEEVPCDNNVNEEIVGKSIKLDSNDDKIIDAEFVKVTKTTKRKSTRK